VKDSYKEIDAISQIAPGIARDRAIEEFLDKRDKIFVSFGKQLCKRNGAEQAGLEHDVTQEVRIEAWKMVTEQIADPENTVRTRVWELQLRYRVTNAAKALIDSASSAVAGTSSQARRVRAMKVTQEEMILKNGVVPSDRELVAHHNEKVMSTRSNAVKQGALATLEDLRVTATVEIESMRSLGIEEERDCVLHPAESETFQRSVVAHCKSQSETLGQVAAIWMEMISAGSPQSEAIAAICQQLPDLSAAQVRRRIHRIRALAVDMLESQLDITSADI
jgi:hypothetical protein